MVSSHACDGIASRLPIPSSKPEVSAVCVTAAAAAAAPSKDREQMAVARID